MLHPITFTIANQVIEFLPVEGGRFTMGSPVGETGHDDDETQHQVTLSSFYMAKYPVTQELYFAVTGQTPSYFTGKKRPVENVNWYDAIKFCNLLSLQYKDQGIQPVYIIDEHDRDNVQIDPKANGFRLPTEAEWEYAARGGMQELNEGYISYAGSTELDEVSWFGSWGDESNNAGETMPIGLKAPNTLGLYDLSGNVYEWCYDWYDKYDISAIYMPTGAAVGSERVVRGGSWGDNATDCRSADRFYRLPGNRNYFIGFRLSRNSS